MKRGTIIFILVTTGIILTHILTGLTTFHLDFSISKYVGLSEVSSIVFLVSNTLVAFLFWNELSKKLSDKISRILIGTILICLIGLSICPYGFYDFIIPEPVILDRTPITFLHVVFSRTMFVLMAIFSAYSFYLSDLKKKYQKKATKFSLFFVIFALAIFALYLFSPETFWNYSLIFESTYILFFFNVLLLI